jgi:hypothetical protein
MNRRKNSVHHAADVPLSSQPFRLRKELLPVFELGQGFFTIVILCQINLP